MTLHLILWCPTKVHTIWRYMHHYNVSALIPRGNKFIVFQSPQAKQDLSGLSVIVGDSIIQQSSKVSNLGTIFDQFLSLDDYISSVCRSTHFHLRNIGRIRDLLSQNATAQLIHALIFRFVLTIATQYYTTSLITVILRLQRIHNQAAQKRRVVIISQRFLLIYIG